MSRKLALALMLAAAPLTVQAEEVAVFAAASLKTALDQIAADWQAETGHRVLLSYGGSNKLAVQIMQGRLDPAAFKDSRDSTIKFAIAMERRFAGDETGARALLTEIVRENPQGHWPSEAELAAPDRRGY